MRSLDRGECTRGEYIDTRFGGRGVCCSGRCSTFHDKSSRDLDACADESGLGGGWVRSICEQGYYDAEKCVNRYPTAGFRGYARLRSGRAPEGYATVRDAGPGIFCHSDTDSAAPPNPPPLVPLPPLERMYPDGLRYKVPLQVRICTSMFARTQYGRSGELAVAIALMHFLWDMVMFAQVYSIPGALDHYGLYGMYVDPEFKSRETYLLEWARKEAGLGKGKWSIDAYLRHTAEGFVQDVFRPMGILCDRDATKHWPLTMQHIYASNRWNPIMMAAQCDMGVAVMPCPPAAGRTSCICETPSAGTAGYNGYYCTDRSSGYCLGTQECYAAEPFVKGQWSAGCRVPGQPAENSQGGDRSPLSEAGGIVSLPLGFGPGPVCEAGDSLYSEKKRNPLEPTEIFVYSSTQQCYDAASYTTLERVLCQRNPQECREADPISMQDTLGHTAYARAGSVSRWERDNWNEGSRPADVRTASLPIKKSSFGSRMKEIFDLLMHEDMLSWYWEEATQGKMANFWQIFDGNDESLNVMCQRFDEQYASIAHLGVRTPTCPYSSAGAPSSISIHLFPRLFIYARDRPEFNDEYRSTFLAAVADRYRTFLDSVATDVLVPYMDFQSLSGEACPTPTTWRAAFEDDADGCHVVAKVGTTHSHEVTVCFPAGAQVKRLP